MESNTYGQKKLGLQALAKRFLGKELNKDWRVRGGNWEAPKLSKLQVSYYYILFLNFFFFLIKKMVGKGTQSC